MKKLVFLMGMILFLAACSNSRLEPKPSYGNQVSEFKATDEDGKMFSSQDMKGKVWLADFIFTNCETVCPPMTYNMTQVVDELEKEGVKDYGIISFSVDPKRDTPAKLKAYSEQYGAKTDNWKLMTGYDEKFIRQFGEENFKTIAVPPTAGNDQATHGTSFYLIDQNGTVIKDYIGKDTGDQKFPKGEIVEDVKTLIKEGPYKK